MNFIIGFAGGALSSYYLKNIGVKIWENKSFMIDTKKDQLMGLSIVAFLVKKINETNITKNVELKNINLYGSYEIHKIPFDGFYYCEYNYGYITDFCIKLVSGDDIHNYVWEVYGNNFKKRIEEIYNKYHKCFYSIGNIIIIPLFQYDNYWNLQPRLLSCNKSSIYIDKIQQDFVIDFIWRNSFKGLLFYGPDNIGKGHLVGLIGKKLNRNIYIANNYLKPSEFVDSIRAIPENSIFFLKNIDEIFKIGFEPNKINKDTILGIFDFIAKNVIVIFSCRKVEDYETIPNLFNEDRIKYKFNFYKKS